MKLTFSLNFLVIDQCGFMTYREGLAADKCILGEGNAYSEGENQHLGVVGIDQSISQYF